MTLKPQSPNPLRLRYTPITPSERQAHALRLTMPDLAIASPGAGGKSTILLAAAAQYADTPGYSAIILRRHSEDLLAPGGLVDVASRWWDDGVAVRARHTWLFDGGGEVAFAAGPDDDADIARWVERYRGQQFDFVGLDEAQEWPDATVAAMLRQRVRPTGEIPGRFRVTYTDHAGIDPKPVGMGWITEWFLDPASRRAPVLPLTHFDNPAIDSDEFERLARLYGLV